MSKEHTRRTVLVGAGTAALAAVVTELPTKPAWLVVAEADLKADPWLGFSMFGPSTALTILRAETDYRHDGVDPLRYDRELRAGLAKCLAEGQATIAANGRLFITEHGRKVEREEWLESWS